MSEVKILFMSSQVVAKHPLSLGCALGLLTIVAMNVSTTPAAAGFFDFMFGALMSPVPGPANPSISQSGRLYAGYCVRLCDGRYFPVRPGATSKAVCEGLCPATKTKLFFGTEIGQATADDGSTYQRLPNAFAYRERMVPDCTCNGRDTVGIASMKIEDDPTLQSGDLIATDHGLVPFRAGRNANAFTPIDRKLAASAERDAVLTVRPQRRAPTPSAAQMPAAMPAPQQW